MPYFGPQTLTRNEQKTILRKTACNPRDHLIYSLALGTGLRLAEIVGLNVEDVYAPQGRPRNRLRIRPEIAKGGRTGDIFLPDALVAKLRKFWVYKAKKGEGLQHEDPLFCSQSRIRISKRRVQYAFRTWQVKAGFDRLYPFHALRHTAVTNVYRVSRDLFLAQRFARHVSPLTTTIYTHPSDQDMWEKVRGLAC
jgi:site-specific recombinase XerC